MVSPCTKEGYHHHQCKLCYRLIVLLKASHALESKDWEVPAPAPAPAPAPHEVVSSGKLLTVIL